MLKAIVCALDGSAESELALSTALALTATHKAHLYVLAALRETALSEDEAQSIRNYEHVEGLRESPAYLADESHEEHAQDLIRHAEREAEKVDVSITKSDIRIGHPADDILSYASEVGADGIVIGNHDKGLFSLIGTAHKVISKAEGTVISVTSK